MSALETRAPLVEHPHDSLSPLPLTGAPAPQLDDWIHQGVAQAHAGELQPLVRTTASEAVVIAQGYEFERPCTAAGAVAPVEWTERVLVIHAPTHAAQQTAGLERRLATTEQQLRA